jgi:hypothetical protein
MASWRGTYARSGLGWSPTARGPRLFFVKWLFKCSANILGATNAVSENLVSQFEALAAEDIIAHRENRPMANRFKRRPSVWPTIEPSTQNPDTQRLTSMKIYRLNDPRKNTERFLIMVCRTGNGAL